MRISLWMVVTPAILVLLVSPFAPRVHGQPTNRNAQRAMAQALVSSGRWPEAEEILRLLVRGDPTDIEARYMLGELLYRQGYYAACIPLLTEVLGANPGHRRARAMRAVSQMKGDQVSSGETEARALLAEKPPINDVDLTLTLAEVVYDRGELDAALALADQAVTFAPAHPIPHFWRARVLLRQKKIAAAAESAERSVQLAPQLPYAHDLLSRIYRLQGRAADAQREAEWLRAFERRKAEGVGR